MMNDIISAVSTPFGKGGIAVIRISGKGSFELADRMFRPGSGKPLAGRQGGRVVYGDILFDGERIDDGCAILFRAPNSYTGEDTVEISCHGGILVTSKVYESTLLCGARPAEAGEFTRRAFLSGRMGLTQAEAVIDLIDAETEEAVRLAANGTSGKLGREAAELRERIVALLAEAYVLTDYPDEELSDLTTDKLTDEIKSIAAAADRLLATYKTGHAVADGIDTVICGRPNTGKSSLLNALLGRDRAIVTSIAGTTRDTIEEKCSLGRVTLNLCDTAGIHQSEDSVELMGIDRARQKLSEAELALAVFDISAPLTDDDRDILCALDPHKAVIVLNKSDLHPCLTIDDFAQFPHVAVISCEKKEGLDALRVTVEEMFIDGEIDYSRAVLTNARQHAALSSARRYLDAALDAIESGFGADTAGLDLELAAGAVGELDGISVLTEVVDTIFARFCVGK